MSSIGLNKQGFRPGASLGNYPQREEPQLDGLDIHLNDIKRFLGRFNKKSTLSFAAFKTLLADNAKQLPGNYCPKLQVALLNTRRSLRSKGLNQHDILSALNIIRIYADKSLKLRPYDEQLYGAWIITQGQLAQMATGEGKSLTSAIAASCIALAGIPVHAITTNEYLAERDALEMTALFKSLAVSCGSVKADMSTVERRNIYARDISYCTNKQIAFDYLRDKLVSGDSNVVLDKLQRFDPNTGPVLRGLCFAIVDEADSIFIDEACTPLLLSREIEDQQRKETYQQALSIASALDEKQHFHANIANRTLQLTQSGVEKILQLCEDLDGLWCGQKRAQMLVRQALSALCLFQRNTHYIVRDDKVEIIDTHTGRTMPDRSWEQGLHQMIECKENCPLTGQRETLTRISYQRFFKRYLMLAGMSGTLDDAASELQKVYGLSVSEVPRHKPTQVDRAKESIYANDKEKWRALIEHIKHIHTQKQPILIASNSVENSQYLSKLLTKNGLSHQVLNALQDKNEAEIIAGAGQTAKITVSTNMAGRGTDIKLGPGVQSLGGLHVVCTDRNDSRRVDKQLFGRCGRQGDPGSTVVFLSLNTPLLNSFYPSSVLNLLKKPLLLTTINNRQVLAKSLCWLAQHHKQRQLKTLRANVINQDKQLDTLLAFAGKQ